jgi:hypothetical protein
MVLIFYTVRCKFPLRKPMTPGWQVKRTSVVALSSEETKTDQPLRLGANYRPMHRSSVTIRLPRLRVRSVPAVVTPIAFASSG